MLLSSVLAIVTLVAAPAAAHFKMTNPVPRGDREVTMDKAPCGGFDTPSRKRTCFGPNFSKVPKTFTNNSLATSSSPRLLITGSFTSVLMLLSVFNIVEKSLVILHFLCLSATFIQ
ncbi:hypothetical protein BSLG_003317 [Batrachochytrium salamandrivorans]|nr:hypothetical protein BSLG_003317 [Batrachochytrium salamandrivorans]